MSSPIGSHPPPPPVALTIAGFDTSAGAGLQADLLTFHNQGYHCLTATTSLVIETPLEVIDCQPVTAHTLLQQVELLAETYSIAVVKIGLIATPEQAQLLSTFLPRLRCPIVLDPVGISSTGSSLQAPETLSAIRSELAPLTTVLTPNLPEAARLLATPSKGSPEEMALQLAEQCGTSVLLTGGHQGDQHQVCDLLVTGGVVHSFCDAKLFADAALHGTGCVLAAALAAGLGKGLDLPSAVVQARTYLRESFQHHHRFPHPEPLLALNHQLAPKFRDTRKFQNDCLSQNHQHTRT